MKKYLDYLTDAVIKCKISYREDTDKIDLFILYANKQIESIANVAADKIIDKYLTDVFPNLTDSVFDWPKILSEAAMTNDYNVIEQYVAAFEKYVRLSVFGYEDKCFYIVITDLTEKKDFKRNILERDRQIKHLEAELKIRANEDVLTKLYNYQFLIDCINNSIDSYIEENIKFCLLLIDIDDFKKINLDYGIKTGDIILHDLALLISSSCRKIDIAGRYGDDKFIVIFNNLDIDIAKLMTERLKQDLEKHVFIRNIKITVSGTLIEYNNETVEELLITAENEVKRAKSLGKGTLIYI